MKTEQNQPAVAEGQAIDQPNGEPNGVNGEGEPVEGELEDKRMSLLEHLQELRQRLRNAAIAFLVAMIASFYFCEKFFEVLARPLCDGILKALVEQVGPSAATKGCEFQATSPTEGFWVMMKLAIVGGLIVAAPLVFWELWKFVAPGLYKKERRIALAVTGATGACFAIGSVFGYFVLAQPAGYFLTKMLGTLSHGTIHVEAVYKIEDVANFLMLTLAGCGVSFELPVLLVLLGAIGIISARALWKFNKYALILSAVVGAVLTPSTDPFTQCLLAGPLFALYNISIVLVWLIERTRRKRDADLEKGEGAAG
jgi:sec-independent protein translocase protein TatC